jgi:hypothetical protein
MYNKIALYGLKTVLRDQIFSAQLHYQALIWKLISYKIFLFVVLFNDMQTGSR